RSWETVVREVRRLLAENGVANYPAKGGRDASAETRQDLYSGYGSRGYLGTSHARRSAGFGRDVPRNDQRSLGRSRAARPIADQERIHRHRAHHGDEHRRLLYSR